LTQTVVKAGTASTVSSSATSAVFGQSVTLTDTVAAVSPGAGTPTGTVTFKLYDNANGTGTPLTVDANEPLVNGVATSKGYTATATGTDYWVAVYSGDSTYPTASGTASLMVTGLTATVKVTPAASSITTASSLSVTVAVTGSGATPTGTVTLSGGGYTSIAVALSSGSATITIPANSLSAGNDTLTASYSGDANYAPATGGATGTAPVTVSPSPRRRGPTASPSSPTSSRNGVAPGGSCDMAAPSSWS